MRGGGAVKNEYNPDGDVVVPRRVKGQDGGAEGE